MYYIYPAARADEDEVDASSGASDRAPRTSKQSMLKCATPTMSCCHMNEWRHHWGMNGVLHRWTTGAPGLAARRAEAASLANLMALASQQVTSKQGEMKKRKKDKLVAEDVKLDSAPAENLPHGLPKKKSRRDIMFSYMCHYPKYVECYTRRSICHCSAQEAAAGGALPAHAVNCRSSFSHRQHPVSRAGHCCGRADRADGRHIQR